MNGNHIYQKNLTEIYALLCTSAEGLSTSQLETLKQKFGSNTIPEKAKRAFIFRFGKHLLNLFAVLLWAGSVLAFVGEMLEPGEGMFYIGLSLLVVVFLNAGFTYYQESKAEQAMASFKTLMPPKATVVRDGQEIVIFAKDLLPGDIIYLAEGDKVPADAVLFEANALKVNNAALTGESEPQLRSIKPTHENILESRNVVFSGTVVSAGNGKAIVFATGANTELGRIAKTTLEVTPVPTPIHRELQHFITVITLIAVVLGVVFFVIGYLVGNTFWTNLVFAIGILVANVPEGLLPTVTLALSIASQKMARKNVLIKTLESVETLGSTTVICTDKTGTLTTGDMQVKTVYFDFQDLGIEQVQSQKQTGAFQLFLQAATLCNNAKLLSLDTGVQAIGDPTETALLKYSQHFVDIQSLNQTHQRICGIPFDSKTKKMITVNQMNGSSVGYIKGAPEVILKHCASIMDQGKVVQLTSAHREQLKKQVEAYASNGGRILGLAYKLIDEYQDESTLQENNYVFIALVNLYDPPRVGVKEAVQQCHQSGVKIIVFSGDHPLTIQSISREVEIISSKQVTIITGYELDQLSHAELADALKHSNVIFARTSPSQKLRIVSMLQERGEVVAVTGDGVNDAPALKRADIGIAMGVTGTDVAKEAADMVLMNDDFSTIVYAIKQGRAIFDNIKKFIAYILTSNIPEILPFIAFVIFGIPLPLTIILILAIDLGTDMVPAIGLGQEEPDDDIMFKPPRKKSARLLTLRLLVRSYVVVGPIQAVAGFFAYFYIILTGGWHWGQQLAFADPLYQKAITAFFFSIIIVQISDVLICRSRNESIFKKGFFTNHLVLIGIVCELLLGLIVVYAPFAHIIFNTHSLSLIELLLGLPFAVLIFALDELRKFLIYKNNSFSKQYLTW